jgi:hypothetical protein
MTAIGWRVVSERDHRLVAAQGDADVGHFSAAALIEPRYRVLD